MPPAPVSIAASKRTSPFRNWSRIDSTVSEWPVVTSPCSTRGVTGSPSISGTTAWRYWRASMGRRRSSRGGTTGASNTMAGPPGGPTGVTGTGTSRPRLEAATCSARAAQMAARNVPALDTPPNPSPSASSHRPSAPKRADEVSTSSASNRPSTARTRPTSRPLWATGPPDIPAQSAASDTCFSELISESVRTDRGRNLTVNRRLPPAPLSTMQAPSKRSPLPRIDAVGAPHTRQSSTASLNNPPQGTG